jgi:Xaa-Pro aminopeptidase
MSARLGQPSAKTHPHLLKEGQITPSGTREEYQERRRRLIENLPPGSAVIIPAAKHHYMTNDIPYVYRQNTDFSYMCGVQEPNSLMVLSIDEKSQSPHFHLFLRPRSEHSELWDGPRTGVERACEFFGCDQASNIEELPVLLPEILEHKSKIFWLDIETDVAQYKSLIESANVAAKEELKAIMCQMRLVKTASEIETMRKSCSISANAFIDVMKATTPECSEHVMSARIEYECRRRGSQRLAYPPVVATGISCNTLHYVMNDSIAKNGDLMLMDAGGEYFDYASDITRTWPTNGIFSLGQRIVYEAVLRTQKKVIEAAKPKRQIKTKSGESLSSSVTLAVLQEIATQSILAELHDMGITDTKYLHKCYPHMIGHFLGMDVHDVPRIGYQVPLRPGMIITVEPGIYLPNEPWVPEALRGIGVRIEDDVLITDSEPEVLTHECPKEIADLERIIGTADTL